MLPRLCSIVTTPANHAVHKIITSDQHCTSHRTSLRNANENKYLSLPPSVREQPHLHRGQTRPGAGWDNAYSFTIESFHFKWLRRNEKDSVYLKCWTNKQWDMLQRENLQQFKLRIERWAFGTVEWEGHHQGERRYPLKTPQVAITKGTVALIQSLEYLPTWYLMELAVNEGKGFQ